MKISRRAQEEAQVPSHRSNLEFRPSLQHRLQPRLDTMHQLKGPSRSREDANTLLQVQLHATRQFRQSEGLRELDQALNGFQGRSNIIYPSSRDPKSLTVDPLGHHA